METPLRSIVKTFSYRIAGVFVTGIIAFAVTHDSLTAIKIGFADTFAKIIVFYFHERLWNRVKFGRAKPRPEYEI